MNVSNAETQSLGKNYEIRKFSREVTQYFLAIFFLYLSCGKKMLIHKKPAEKKSVNPKWFFVEVAIQSRFFAEILCEKCQRR